MKVDERIGATYKSRIMLALMMEEVADLLKDPLTLDAKYDEEVKKIYKGLSKSFEMQLALEESAKK